MKLKTNRLSVQQGFSLVELLVVIAVIAIIAAIAIPNIANITSQATVAKNQRNAQNVASVAAAAIAAGYSGSNWTTLDAALADLQSTNIVVKNTAGGNMTFSVSELGDTVEVKKYLTLSPIYTASTAPQINYTQTAQTN